MSNTLNSTQKKDIIVYHYDKIYGLDKEEIEKNRNLSEYYDAKSTAKSVSSEVVNPQEELRKISKKLTAREKFILNNFFIPKK